MQPNRSPERSGRVPPPESIFSVLNVGVLESVPGRESNEELRLTASLRTPFDTVEDAHEYVRLLGEAIAEAKREIEADLAEAANAKSKRRLQALQLVQFQLDKLEQHLKTSSRLLNDLRTLRRLLLEERFEFTPNGKDSAA